MKRNALLTFTITLVFGVSILGSGCTQQSQTEKPDVPPEQQIRERVEARWKAVMEMEYAKVYSFATPAYRQAHNEQHLLNQYGGQITRTGYEIKSISIRPDAPDTADVVSILHFRTSGVTGPPVESLSRIEQTWVRRDGEWWYVEPR